MREGGSVVTNFGKNRSTTVSHGLHQLFPPRRESLRQPIGSMECKQEDAISHPEAKPLMRN